MLFSKFALFFSYFTIPVSVPLQWMDPTDTVEASYDKNFLRSIMQGEQKVFFCKKNQEKLVYSYKIRFPIKISIRKFLGSNLL